VAEPADGNALCRLRQQHEDLFLGKVAGMDLLDIIRRGRDCAHGIALR